MAKEQNKKPIKTFWRMIIKLPNKPKQHILFIFIDATGQNLFELWDTNQAFNILKNVDSEYLESVNLEHCMMWRHEKPQFGQGTYRCTIHASLNGGNGPYLVLREQEQTVFSPNGNINKPSQILGRLVPMIMNRCN
ncbi:MAG: hypothetical protein ACNFW9_06290 [Candidatus Kerfeldbacteria bacterium]|jgi:hypothetical protein